MNPGVGERSVLEGAVLLLLMLFLPAGCASRLERFEFTRLEMGVRARVVTYSPSRRDAESAAAAAFQRISLLDACMSDYRPDSELMRLCDAPAGTPVALSPDLFQVLTSAARASKVSDGAFDATAGPVVGLWRAARKEHRLPPPDAIRHAITLVGWRNLKLEDATHSATLRIAGMKLDLGGIAKGFAAQRAAETLRSLGQARCLVALAGDIAVGDPPPGATGWKIDVEGGSAAPRTLVLANAAVSTSGDTEQFVELGGRRYSHIVDPRTGQAMTSSVRCTVVAHGGEVADSLSTAISVLGARAGAGLARDQRVSAIIQEPGEPAIEVDAGGLLRWAAPD